MDDHPNAQNEAVAVSAPGKVLFAGGFLVLDRHHTGLVFGLDARIHVRVERWMDAPSRNKDDLLISVRSPQFQEAAWLYSWTTDRSEGKGEGNGVIHQLEGQDGYTNSANSFVETTLQYTLTYLLHLHLKAESNLKITILADDDYYSHTQPRQTGKFTDFQVSLRNAHKTGLGSSAALVTALVAGLMSFLNTGISHLFSANELKTIHNLAQAAHCAAQGKVGSGFDVAAAVFGSSLYRRFTPSILEKVGDSSAPDFGERLHRCVADLDPDQRWDADISSKAVNIPQSLRLVMCDVDCGSETPGMVRKVLAWRKEKADEANLLWAALQQGTEDLCIQLTQLSKLEGIAVEGQQELGDVILTIRSLVREMSEKSGVAIEPPVITALLDYCTSLPGVIGGVAPGAGGYDAVALLVRNDTEVVRDLQERLQGWQSKGEPGTGATIGKVSLLTVKQEQQGVRSEVPDRYQTWT